MSGHAYTAPAVRTGPLTRRRGLSDVGAPLAFSGLCLVALAAVWLLANLVPALQLRDAVLLHDFTLLAHPPLASIANTLDHLLEPSLFVLWGIALVAFAVARERPRTALAVAMIMWLAPLCSETLKPLLAHSHQSVGGVFIGAGSWPSGHSTAALTLGLCAVLVSPPRWRPFTAVVAALFAAAVGASLLILAWHMPSDVLGGYLVASFWTGIAVACLRLANRRWPQDRPDPI
jgi:membrane-associated phospholipid phosphatase